MLRDLLGLIFFLFISGSINAQLTLSNNDKTIKIPVGAYLEMGSQRFHQNGSGCTVFKTNGELLRSSLKEVELEASEFTMTGGTPENSMARMFSLENDQFLPVTIPTNEISWVRVFKSKKQQKAKGNKRVFGGILITTGVVTALNLFAVKKESKKNLGISAGIQIGGGILLAVLGSKKKYSLENGWVIE